MSSWQLVLETYQGDITLERRINLGPDSPHLTHIEGVPHDVSTWHFTTIGDDTQVKDQYVCDIELRNGALLLTTEVDGIRIRPPQSDSGEIGQGGYFDLPNSSDYKSYIVLLRDGDIIDFSLSQMRMKVFFVPVLEPDLNVEVVSSAVQGPPVESKIEEDERDMDDGDLDVAVDDTQMKAKVNPQGQDDTQEPYSTGRERLTKSPQSNSRTYSQIIQESPVRPRTGLQPEDSTLSRVADSIPQSSFFGGRSNAKSATRLNASLSGQSEVIFAPAEIRRPRPRPDADQEFFSGDQHASVDANVNLQQAGSPDQGEENEHIVDTIHMTEDGGANDSQALRIRPTESQSTEEDPAGATDPTGTPGKPFEEIETSAPSTAGKKRKPAKVEKPVREANKRRRRTESERLSEENGSHPGNTLSESTPTRNGHRSSIQVVVSQNNESGASMSEHQGQALSNWKGDPPRILFPSESKTRALKGHMRFLKEQKVREAKDEKPRSFDMFIVEGEVRTTAKLLMSLVHDKTIVTDDWVLQSVKEGRLLDPVPFLPSALQDSMDRDRSIMFADITIYVTPKLRVDYKKGWDDIHAIVQQTGATVLNCAPSRIPKGTEVDIYLGSDKDDPHVTELQTQGKYVYHKDLLTNSILAGQLANEAEFALPELTGDAASDTPKPASSNVGKGGAKGLKGKGKKK